VAFQWRSNGHRRSGTCILGHAERGTALSQIQPGAAEAESGEPRAKGAGFRGLCAAAEGLFQERQT